MGPDTSVTLSCKVLDIWLVLNIVTITWVHICTLLIYTQYTYIHSIHIYIYSCHVDLTYVSTDTVYHK